MSRLLIISPHLDDGVLSCGASIARNTSRGATVMVATCFTSPGEQASKKMQEHYQQRRADDYAALDAVGATPLHLGFTDAPFRNPRYHNFNTILFHHQSPAGESQLISSLTTAIQILADQWRPDEIFFPLGVGGHIDHHLVWESSRSLWDSPYPLSYYEELPYALIAGWSAVRFRQLGAVPRSAVNKAPVIKTDLAALPYPFVRNYLSSQDDRQRSTRLYDDQFTVLHPGDTASPEWRFEHSSLFHNLLELDQQYLDKKCTAITRYTTEWPMLFDGSAEAIPNMLRRYENAGPYTEAGWRLKTKR